MERMREKAQCSPMKISFQGLTVEGPVSEVMKCVQVYERNMQQRALPTTQRRALTYGSLTLSTFREGGQSSHF